MWMLKDIGVDWRDRNFIAKLYFGQTAVIRIDGELAGCCIIGQGVRQGCPLSPLLFNISSMSSTKHWRIYRKESKWEVC